MTNSIRSPVDGGGGVLTSGGSHLLELVSRGPLDEPKCIAVLDFALAHEQVLLGEDAPVRIARGFTEDRWPGFDCVVAIDPRVHSLHRARIPELHKRVLMVAAARSWELLPALSVSEAKATMKATKSFQSDRPENALARGRYRTHTSTLGRRRALLTEAEAVSQVGHLAGGPGRFIEVENAAGELAVIRWETQFIVEGDANTEVFDETGEAVAWLRAFLRRPPSAGVQRPGGLTGVSGRPLGELFTLEMSDGTVADSLADWHLEEELDRLAEPGEPVWASFRRSGQSYVQTHVRDDGLYDIEYRDGAADQHFTSTTGVELGIVKRLFVLFGLEDESWRTVATWKRLRV